MITPELLKYVNSQIQAGLNRDQIYEVLKKAGWQEMDIREAIFRTSSAPPSIPQTMYITKRKSSWGLGLVFIFIVVLAGGAFWWTYNNQDLVMQKLNKLAPSLMEIISSSKEEEDDNMSTSTVKALSFDDSDLFTVFVRLDDINNSKNAFAQMQTENLAQASIDFVEKYLSTSTPSLPPLAQTQKIVTDNVNDLKIFNPVKDRTYQCSIMNGDLCNLTKVRNLAYILSLDSLTYFLLNKKDSARLRSAELYKLSKGVASEADDPVTLLLGWSLERLAFNTSKLIGADTASIASSPEKLKEEHKRIIRVMYTRMVEYINNVQTRSLNAEFTKKLDPEELAILNNIRSIATTTNWDKYRTQRYFYDSYKKAMSNVDLACGTELQKTEINVGYDAKNTTDPNYAGKMLYSMFYASFDSMNSKRCDLEKLIKAK